MTRIEKPETIKASKSRKVARDARAGRWVLQDAKARFSEVVRLAHSAGPQHVTVHGREEVVIVSADEFRRLKGDRSGAALIEVMQSSPHRDISLALPRAKMPVRDVKL